jgi:hypothetical protein
MIDCLDFEIPSTGATTFVAIASWANTFAQVHTIAVEAALARGAGAEMTPTHWPTSPSASTDLSLARLKRSRQ